MARHVWASLLRLVPGERLAARAVPLCCLLAGLAAAAAAQVPDSTQHPPPDSLYLSLPDTTLPDTSRTGRATRRAPLVTFGEPATGIVFAALLPVRQPALDATSLLAEVPGSFVYDFGTPGWPNGWSPFGLAPHRAALLLDDRPFDDLFTGRPRFDLLPLAYGEPLRLDGERLARPLAVQTRFRPFDVPRPLTELRYMAGGTGLQSIDAVHIQNRRRALFGQTGMLQVLGAYSGRAAQGEYPGSRLRRGRQTLVRLRFAMPGAAFELANLHNRRHVGAHGGVIPISSDYETIYLRDFASVERPEAMRYVKRNDLSATARALLLPAIRDPLTLSAYWTAQTFRYRNRDDTLVASLDRYGFRAQQAVTAGRHRLQLRLDGWLDTVTGDSSTALPSTRRGQFHVAVRDSLRLFAAALVAEAGLHAYGGAVQPGGTLRWERSAGTGRLFVTASLAGQPPTWVETHGFGHYVAAAPAEAGRLWQVGGGFHFHAGAFDALLFGFAHRDERARDLFATETADVVAVRTLGTPLHRAGIAADVGWRRDAGRGFYLTFQPTWLRLLNADASPDHRRLAATLPTFFARARLGARYLLFQGDLDLDLSLRGRFWTTMRSRELHPQTGLLVVPLQTARRFSPSGLLDVVAEAGVREATFFFVYENILSGTALMPGTLLVPDYPFPEQRFRFGVYWPILD